MLLLEQFEHLTLHPKNAVRLKALVLQLAVQGKLTENWRRQNPDVEPASELLKRIESEKAQLVKDKKIKKDKPLEPIPEDEVPYTLPEGWVWCRFGEVITFTNGYAFQSSSFTDEGIGVIRIGDLQNGHVVKYTMKYIESADCKGLIPDYSVEPGAMLIAMSGATTGKIAFNNSSETFLLNQRVGKITPILINSGFLSFILNTKVEENLRISKGSAIPNISTAQIKDIIVPHPPLAEQEAIVARVEELMQKIEELEQQTAERIKLKKNLSTAALQQLTTAPDEELQQNWLFLKQHFQSMFDETANVKKLRETILQLAVQGKLTTNWRKYNPATEPASELLKRIQAEKAQLVKEKKIKKEKPLEPISEDEVPYTLPEGWVWCRFGELILDIEAGKSPSCEPQEANIDEWGVIKISAVSWGEFLERENKKLPASVPPFEDKEIIAGDFIMSRANTADLIARSVVVGDSVRFKLLLNDKTLRVRFQSDIVKVYCNLFNNCSVARAYYKEVATGTSDSMKNIGREQIKNLLVPLPPETEQKAIVAKVDQLMQLCNELEQQIQQSKLETGALMQAVVQEALQVQEEVEL